MSEFPENGMLETLATLGIETIPKAVGGWGSQQTWGSALTLTEQQLLVLPCVNPRVISKERSD